MVPRMCAPLCGAQIKDSCLLDLSRKPPRGTTGGKLALARAKPGLVWEHRNDVSHPSEPVWGARDTGHYMLLETKGKTSPKVFFIQPGPRGTPRLTWQCQLIWENPKRKRVFHQVKVQASFTQFN